MSQNVLFKYYPIWLANCKESLKFLQSTEYDAFCAQHNIVPKTLEQRQAAIEDYKNKIAYYEKMLNP